MKFKSCYPILLCLWASQPVIADELWDISSANTERWECEYCPAEPYSNDQLGLNLGYLDDSSYRFGHLSGIDEGSQWYPTFNLSHFDPKKDNWRVGFSAQSMDAKQLDFNWQRPAQWQIVGRYQDFPVRNYAAVYSPFSASGGNQLSLPTDWQYLDSMQQLQPNLNQTTRLAVDWQKLDLGLRLNTKTLRYAIDYSRTEKSGVMAASTAQILNAFYLPAPVDQTMDTLALSVAGQWQLLNYSVAYSVSRFDNQYSSLTFDVPYQPLVAGATQGQLAQAPDNTAYQLSGNLQLRLADSSIKAYAAFGKQEQNEALLPYTLNADLAQALPTPSADLTVSTKHFDLRYYTKLSRRFSINSKYTYRQRDNQSQQWVFNPVINDVYTADGISNVPYDYSKRKFSVAGKWRFEQGRSASIQWQQDKNRRNYTIQSSTRDAGFEGKLHLPFADNSLLHISAQRFERSGRQWQIIDLIETEVDPSLQKFTEADRKQQGANLMYSTSFGDFGLQLNGQILDTDYQGSLLGLEQSESKLLDITLDWRITPTMAISGYAQRQRVESRFHASQSVVSGIWTGTGEDNLDGYGVNFTAKELWDKTLTFNLKWHKSTGDSDIAVSSILTNELLPTVSSEWTSLQSELRYRKNDHWTMRLAYKHDKFVSSDYALDLAAPNSIRNLLTFGALSHNYKVNYIVFTLIYSF